MTKSIKKTMATLLAFVMVLGMAVSSFAYEVSDDLKGTKYEEAGAVLGALNIMIGDPDGNFRPEDGIKRSEFSKIAVHALGLEDSANASEGNTQFNDVPADYWANGYINIATGQKLIQGDPDGNFRPEDRISYQEAVTILIRMTGYEPAAIAKGGYPNGYLMVATQYGFNKNAPGSGPEATKRGLAAILTYNALSLGMMEQTGFGDNTNYEITDKTLMKNNLSTEKKTGQVTGNHFTKLESSSSLDKDQIELDGAVYKNQDQQAPGYLGYKVNYYIKTLDNNDEVIILVRPDSNKNKSLGIDGDNIATVSIDRINYWINKETDTSTKNAKLDAKAKMIFNGVSIEFDIEKIKQNGTLEGNVILLDVNTDDLYDIVFVNEFSNLVVDTTSELSFTVTDKYGNPSLKFDEDDTTVKFEIINKDGEIVKFQDLKEWDVISYLQSADKGVLKAVVTNEKAVGTVKEINDDKYKIGDNFYKLAANYKETIKLDDEGTYYLDIRGNIAAANANSTLSDNYVFLIDGAEAQGLNDYVELKIFNSKGESTVLKSADKVSLNGTDKVIAKDILPKLKNEEGKIIKQLLTYEVNSNNEFTKLNTAEDVSADGITINKDKFVMNFKGEDVKYKSASNKLGSFNVTDSTVVFDIPDTATSEDDYAIKSKSMFENDGLYNVEVYDVTDDLSASIILVTNSSGITNVETPIAVINQISTTRNEKGETVEKLYAAQNGQMIAMETSSTGILVDSENKQLQPGDVIQFRTNAQGAIDRISVLFQVKNKTTEFTKTDGDMQLVYGKVDRKFATSINVTVKDAGIENYNIDKAKVISVDTSKSNNKVTLSSSGDIQKYDAASPRLVFLRIYKDAVQEVIIVK